MDKYFANRHSVRKFSDRPVSDELLADILNAAMHAPTTGNMQLYTVIVTRNPENKARLARQHFNQPASVNAPISNASQDGAD